MTRLIDADEFELYVQKEWENNEISNSDWIQFREWLRDQETVLEFDGDLTKVIVRGEEYFPVKHGEWTEREVDADGRAIDEWQSAKCSACGLYHTTPYLYYFDEFKYCPNCGTRMGE